MKWVWVIINVAVILAIILFAISPLISVAIAGTIANTFGCDLDEGSVHPCLAFGRDLGETLYAMGVLGWLGLATLPLGAGLLGIYLIVLIVFLLLKRVRRAYPRQNTP